MKDLYGALRGLGRWLWGQRVGVRDYLRFPSTKRLREATNNRTAARARFWEGVREGQREAEARSLERDR
jgi:hypothetical protein